jgi:hypothetical protein
MSETTLTHENLVQIYAAMLQIKPIDRSVYFDKYFKEVKDRLEEIRFLHILKDNKNEWNK